MRIGFLMDPLDDVRVDHDSTFALILECQRRGLQVLELRQEWLYFAEGGTRSRTRARTPPAPAPACGRSPGRSAST